MFNTPPWQLFFFCFLIKTFQGQKVDQRDSATTGRSTTKSSVSSCLCEVLLLRWPNAGVRRLTFPLPSYGKASVRVVLIPKPETRNRPVTHSVATLLLLRHWNFYSLQEMQKWGRGLNIFKLFRLKYIFPANNFTQTWSQILWTSIFNPVW